MIKNIIFDFGGVILKHKPMVTREILSQMFPHQSDKASEIFQQYWTPLSTGKSTSDDFIAVLKSQITTKLSHDELMKKWKELYQKEVQDVDWKLLEFIVHLSNKYKVYLFTDTIDVHDEYNKTRGIYDKFDKTFKSYEEGVAKSEGTEAFVYMLKKIESKPEECIFIDDLEKNVELSKLVGMQGIVYTNLDQLKETLRDSGIN